jgi:N6-adenosine-specific RNA methylase IME4
LPVDEQRKLATRAVNGERVSAKTRVKQVRREERERELGQKQIAAPEKKKYGVIVEDFEFDFEPWSRETGMDRHAANHYETAVDAHTPEEIVARTEERFRCAADDCVLFMCTPAPFLDIVMNVVRLRGFQYKSQYILEKDRAITGHWSKMRHENLLVAVRGKVPCPAPGTQWESIIKAPVGEHSVKPDRLFEMIEAYYPTLPKIELNRRGPPRPGWDAWGNEVEPAPSAPATTATTIDRRAAP